jgi:methyltransferase (TIGR00027 family)
VRTFEVDTPRTQAFKRQMVELAGLDGDRVTYVPADFSFQDWLPLLEAAGFDPRRRTFFLWESVSMYLDREAVESTLRKIATTAPGSILAFDYFSLRLLGAPSAFMRYARALLQASGEPFGTFALDADQVKGFVTSCGLALEEQRHFGGGMAGFAVARVP